MIRGLRVKKTIYALHRWLGVISIVFLINFSATGILLNHAEHLSLYESYISFEPLLEWYQDEAAIDVVFFQSGDDTALQVGERLFINLEEVYTSLDSLIGFISVDTGTPEYYLASHQEIIILNQERDLIERLPASFIGLTGIDGISIQGADLIIRDRDMLRDIEGRMANQDVNEVIIWSAPSEPLEADLEGIDAVTGLRVSWFDVLSDLHTGRVFLGLGIIIQDLFAIALIILSLLGLYIFIVRNRRLS